MLFNATFHNISVISWWSVLLVEERGENQRYVASHWQTLSHNAESSTPRYERGSNSQLKWWKALMAQVVVSVNYHTIMNTMDLYFKWNETELYCTLLIKGCFILMMIFFWFQLYAIPWFLTMYARKY